MPYKITLRSIVLALNIPLLASAQNQFNNLLTSPLTSRSDPGTVLDESKAVKARQLAEYVITKNKQKSLLHYDPKHTGSDEYQSVQAVMNVGEWNYTVWIANRQEEAGGAERATEQDTISFELRPAKSVKAKEKDKIEKDKVIKFMDSGLDGRCDFGLIPKGMSEDGKEWLYQPASRYFPQTVGEEYRPHFQKLYGEMLEKLVKFYRRK